MNERQAFLAIRNAIRLENLAEDVARRVSPELRAIFNELGEQFKAMPPGNIEREIWYRQAKMRIADIFVPLNEEMRNGLTQTLGDEVGEQMKFAENYLNEAIQDPINEVAITAPPQEGISALGRPTSKVEFTRQQLHTIAEDTRVLGDRLGDLFRPDLDGNGKHGKWIEQNIALIDRKVKTGFLTGMTNDQIAATLPGLGREAVRRNKAIARTAVMDMSARSQEALWQANSDRIQAWEVDGTMDNRICDQCAPWDGVAKTVRGQLPVMPLHVNCRCRVLPLTKTELALREKDGPQRRSVVELIDAPNKEAAIAKAKLKPGVINARAYAKQVRVKGKKYWRVAEDIQHGKDPLTMGEFLQQASPATQEQVLGSQKRRRLFMEKIAGTANRPPISADRALKEVTEWQPTVTRRPRLSMEMKLDISKLKSQEELMKKNSEGEKHIVYGYIRGKDTKYGKTGSLYYVGIADDGGKRPYMPHRPGAHGVPVPKDKRQVRQLAVTKTRAEAERIERAFIAREGRIPVKGKPGLGTVGRRGLLNIAPGGRGTSGIGNLIEKGKLAVSGSHLRAGVSLEEWAKIPSRKRTSFLRWAEKNAGNFADWEKYVKEGGKIAAIARKYKIDPKTYAGMTRVEKTRMKNWLNTHPGQTGSDYLREKAKGNVVHGGIEQTERLKRAAQSASKYGIPLDTWLKLDRQQVKNVAKRYARGKRGAALLEGLI